MHGRTEEEGTACFIPVLHEPIDCSNWREDSAGNLPATCDSAGSNQPSGSQTWQVYPYPNTWSPFKQGRGYLAALDTGPIHSLGSMFEIVGQLMDQLTGTDRVETELSHGGLGRQMLCAIEWRWGCTPHQ